MSMGGGGTPGSSGGWIRRHYLPLGASLVVAAGFAWLLRAGALPVLPDARVFHGIRWWTVAAHGLLYLMALYVRAHRWSWLLAPIHRVSLRRVVSVSFIGYGALVLLPFRTGEVVRPALIRKRGELSGWAATGTVAAERIIDGLFISLVLLVALAVAKPLDPLPDHIGDLPIPVSLVPNAAYGALCVFAAAMVAMGVFYRWRAWARRAIDATIGLASKRLAHWLADAVARVADGLNFLPRFAYTARFLLATALYYALFAVAVELLVWGSGIESIDFAESCAIMGVLHLGVLLPNAPGYFGAFQISVYAGLAMYYAPSQVSGPGSAAVFLMYVLQIGLVLLCAGVALFAERVSPSEALAEGAG
jgi:glycosyltransferase 2 family protein